ncbi:hypothetical protein QVD17_25526 [Tagetes erecta]|uniref:Uncharacterized protein n=1 Tax=Tagetes erecta TaxID=13708 RepID=A0AAD8KJ85_TARER|nr:hypothetical protein QVD17_25526 [Tagetes erecta]
MLSSPLGTPSPSGEVQRKRLAGIQTRLQGVVLQKVKFDKKQENMIAVSKTSKQRSWANPIWHLKNEWLCPPHVNTHKYSPKQNKRPLPLLHIYTCIFFFFFFTLTSLTMANISLSTSIAIKPNSLLNHNFKTSRAITSMVATTSTKVTPSIIVGGGRIGKALQEMGDGDDFLVKRGESVPMDFPGPILVCTRNDDLDAVLRSTPQSRWTDLVFFQNGMLEPWFESKGLSDASQVLAYMAVSKVGEPPVDGITDVNPEGLTAAFGKWGSSVATRLHAAGLSCKVLEKETFQQQMLEKLIWISAFMLVGARHPGATVGVVEKDYRFEVISLIGELASAAAAEKGIAFDVGIEDRLLAYARAVSHFPTAVKEFKWRNGWFYSLSQKAIALGKQDPCPLHTAWLKELNIVQ